MDSFSMFSLFNKPHKIIAVIAKGTRILGKNKIKTKLLISDYNPWISREIYFLVFSAQIHHTLVSLWVWRSPRIDYEIHGKGLLASTLGSYRKGKDTWANGAASRGEETLVVVFNLDDAYKSVVFKILLRTLITWIIDLEDRFETNVKNNKPDNDEHLLLMMLMFIY